MPHVLICESLDRLNRQAPLDALAPFIGLINAGITLVTLTDRQQFTRESMGEDGGLRLLGSLIVMLRAHEESATKSKRVRAAWERKRREADVRKLTKTCPAWLRLAPDRSKFEIVEERADIVRLIFAETASGIGKGSIAARLNDAGVPPFRGKNGWHASYIQKLLSSDAALGIYQPHSIEGGRRVPAGPPVPSYFPPIIAESLALKARAAIIARRHGAAGRKGSNFRNILNGIAQCAACGGSMTYVGKGDLGTQPAPDGLGDEDVRTAGRDLGGYARSTGRPRFTRCGEVSQAWSGGDGDAGLLSHQPSRSRAVLQRPAIL